MLRVLFVFLLLLSCVAKAQDHCAFVAELEKILKTDPIKSANELMYTEKGKFLSVGNGFGPARPGFKSTDEMKCAMQKHGFNMIWAGGDVLGCKNQVALGKSAETYAFKYNQQVKSTLITQGSYQCSL